MEKITQRDLYLSHFIELFHKVKLNDKFIEGLKSHPYFQDYMKIYEKFPDDSSRKSYILLELTRMRSTCEEIIKLLRSSGQEEVANELEKYNTSPGPMTVSTEVSLKVTEAKAENKGSLNYSMTKKPRGKCIIINNVQTLAHKESQRFESIFEQLFFEVKLLNDLTSEKMREKLKLLSKDKSFEKHDALVVMVISHGKDERLSGYNACQGKDSGDSIEIKEIVDIFSHINCTALNAKPKLFFFTCCRGKSESESAEESINQNRKRVKTFDGDYHNRAVQPLKSIDQQWINKNKDTFISYSCSEGHKIFGNIDLGITHFGQALSHSIAQYACEENLQSIMSRTCDLMDKYNELSERCAPESRGQCMRRQLHFNPGFPKQTNS